MTADQIARARKMRENGIPYQKISTASGWSRETIRQALNPEAKERYRVHGIEYRKTHREQERIRVAKYDKAHRGERREYRGTHKEEIRLCVAKYYKTHKEKIDLWNAEYRKTHLAERATYSIEYKKTHGEKIRRCQANYRKTHPAQRTIDDATRRALILGATIGNLAEIKEIYRRSKEDLRIRCYLCGKLIPPRRRHVDHIMPLSKGGAHRSSNLAIACDGCNLEKHAKTPREIGLLL